MCHTCKVRCFFFLALTKHQQTTTDKILDLQELYASTAHFIWTNLFAVFRVGEVNEVVIVHLLCVDDVTVLLLAQVLWVNAVGSQELLVSYTECLADRLSNKLGLRT